MPGGGRLGQNSHLRLGVDVHSQREVGGDLLAVRDQTLQSRLNQLNLSNLSFLCVAEFDLRPAPRVSSLTAVALRVLQLVARRTLKPSVRPLTSHLIRAAYLDVQTLEAAPGVVALAVPPVTRSLGLALVNIIAGPTVGRNPREKILLYISPVAEQWLTCIH